MVGSDHDYSAYPGPWPDNLAQDRRFTYHGALSEGAGGVKELPPDVRELLQRRVSVGTVFGAPRTKGSTPLDEFLVSLSVEEGSPVYLSAGAANLLAQLLVEAAESVERSRVP